MNKPTQHLEGPGGNGNHPKPHQATKSFLYSIWFGPFSLLRSPVFIFSTILTVVIAYFLFQQMQDWKISVVLGVALELILTIIIWQYLLVSWRLEDLTRRAASLDQAVGLGSGHSQSSHHLGQRLLSELRENYTKNFRSSNDMRRSVELVRNNIEKLRHQALGDTLEMKQSITHLNTKMADELDHIRLDLHDFHRGLHESNIAALKEVETTLTELINDTGAHQQRTLEQVFEDQTGHESNIAALKEVETTLTELINDTGAHQQRTLEQFFEDQIGTVTQSLLSELTAKSAKELDERLHGQTKQLMAKLAELSKHYDVLLKQVADIKNDVDSIAERESSISKALDVSTALDRLNIEVRRQLAELRQQLAE